MKTKEQIINEMCMTMRHDFGLEKLYDGICAGMDNLDRDRLCREMRQLIEHHGKDIAGLYR